MKKYIALLICSLSINAFASNDKSINVLAFGDISVCGNEQEEGVKTTSKIVHNQKFDMMFHLGDLVYPEGTEKALKSCYWKYFSSYENKIFPIPGNHEYYADNGQPYFTFFKNSIKNITKQKNYDFPSNDSNFPKYYSFDKQGWSFIFLDSNLSKEEQQEEFKWLEEKLKNKSNCSIVSFHYPLITSGLRPIKSFSKDLEPLLIKYPPTIVLNGHDHHFQESKIINKTKHFLVGSGGVQIKNAVNPLDLNLKNISFEHGILKLTLEKDSYSYSFITDKGEQFKNQESCTQ